VGHSGTSGFSRVGAVQLTNESNSRS
jgi:hypothetical protein